MPLIYLLLALLILFYVFVVPIMVLRLRARVSKLEYSLDQWRIWWETWQAQLKNASAPKPTKSALKVKSPKLIHERENGTEEVPEESSIVKTPLPVTAPVTQEKSFEDRIGGNWFQWLGIAALVIALLFFLKWTFDNGWIGPTGRIFIGYVLCAAAMYAGDRLRAKYGEWSLAFTGGGALGCYIVTWIALHTYQLFPSPVAFAIYILTTLVVCLLAAYYSALPLAAFGIIGGLITPMLLGSGGSMFGLLLYILILDLGICALAHVRQWRVLHVIGLIGTALYEVMALASRELERPTAIAFALLFMAIYLLVPLVYNLWKRQKSEQADVLLLVGNALFHFWLFLQWLGMTPGLREQYDALLALGFAVLFLLWSEEIYRRNRADTPMVLGSVSLAVLFTSLAIPMQFGGMWVPLAWSLESAFLLWVALELKDARLKRFGWIVMGAAYLWYFFGGLESGREIINPMYHDPMLFLIWAFLFVGIASLAFGREDRKEYGLLPFAAIGLGVLTLSFGLNLLNPARSPLSILERFFEALALIGGSYAVLWQAKSKWSTLSESEKQGFTTLGIGVQIVTLFYLSNEYARAIYERRLFAGTLRPQQYLQVGLSILWALYASLALVIGIMRNWKPLRLFGMIVLLIAIAKLTLIDMFSLGTGMRIIGFTILGGLLVSASFLYQRKKEALKEFFVSSTPRP